MFFFSSNLIALPEVILIRTPGLGWIEVLCYSLILYLS